MKQDHYMRHLTLQPTGSRTEAGSQKTFLLTLITKNDSEVVRTPSQEGRLTNCLVAEAFKFLSGSLKAFLFTQTDIWVVLAMFRIIMGFLASVALCHQVSGENATPRKVVCLAPSYVETLIELELTDKLVGVTTSSDYLPEVKYVERVGFYMKPNIEKILSLKPDLVFATGFIGQKPAVKKLRALGIKVITFETRRMEEIFAMTKRVGDLFGVQKRSQELLDRMKRVMKETRDRAQEVSRPRVYVETGYRPLFTCGKGSFINELIEIAGGTNIAADIDNPFPRISSEFILNRNPEVIILPYMGRDFGKDALKKRNGWEKITAVRNGRIYDDIGSRFITIPSPRLILYGLPELLKRIHPETAEDIR